MAVQLIVQYKGSRHQQPAPGPEELTVPETTGKTDEGVHFET